MLRAASGSPAQTEHITQYYIEVKGPTSQRPANLPSASIHPYTMTNIDSLKLNQINHLLTIK